MLIGGVRSTGTFSRTRGGEAPEEENGAVRGSRLNGGQTAPLEGETVASRPKVGRSPGGLCPAGRLGS